MENQKNVVSVKFIKHQKKNGTDCIYLYPKSYMFKVSSKLINKIKINSIVHVKDKKDKTVNVVVQEIKKLPPKAARKHKAILSVTDLMYQVSKKIN